MQPRLFCGHSVCFAHVLSAFEAGLDIPVPFLHSLSYESAYSGGSSGRVPVPAQKAISYQFDAGIIQAFLFPMGC
jgi:hypothetical protein